MRSVLRSVTNYIKDTDKFFWIISLFTSVYGIVLVMSATHTSRNSVKQLTVQIGATIVGYIAALVISRMDYDMIARWWKAVAAVCIGLIVLTFFIGVGRQDDLRNDDKAWLMIFGMTFQPSELAKIGFIITFSHHISRLLENESLNEPLNIIFLCMHGAVPVGLVHLQGDDGSALVFLFIFIVMMFAAGIKLRYFAAAFASLVVILPVMWFYVMDEFQKKRILIIFNPELDPEVTGFQQARAAIAIGSGKLFGQGIFNGSYTQNGMVPEDHNDFIFSVACEELGFFGAITVMVLLGAILVRIFMISNRSRDDLGKLMCMGFFAMIAFQSIANIGMCLSIAPVIGITLPFFSAGGSSTACLYLGIGLVLSVYMQSSSKYTGDRIDFSYTRY